MDLVERGRLRDLLFLALVLYKVTKLNGECIGEPIIAPIEIFIDSEDFVKNNCDVTEINTEKTYLFCNLGTDPFIPITKISGNFPAGCRFYNDYPVVDGTTLESTIYDGFPTDVDSKIYYAVPTWLYFVLLYV